MQSQSHTPNMYMLMHLVWISIIVINVQFVQANIFVYKNNATYHDRLAGFGPRLIDHSRDDNKSGIKGYLVSLNLLSYKDKHGCHPFHDLVKYFPENREKLIVMIQRGECPFVDKVRAMQESGAYAVVIGDNISTGRLITMYASGNTTDIQIPSVFITQWDYNMLNYLLTSKYQQSPLPIIIKPNPSDTLSTFILLLLFILLPIGIVFFVSNVWYWITGGDEDAEQAHQRLYEESMLPATLNMVSQLPKTRYRPETVPLQSECHIFTCGICLEDFEPDEVLRILPCRHMFHCVCIDPWLLGRRRTCPTCKSTIDVNSDAIVTIEAGEHDSFTGHILANDDYIIANSESLSSSFHSAHASLASGSSVATMS